MTLEGYGVKLHRLTEDKLELLRRWRNDPKIQKYMGYREHITADMQKVWFQKINNKHNYYFIIEYEGKEIGCINIKDIDYEQKTGEPGIFIWDDDYLNTDVPIRASILQGDFIWDTLRLESQHIHVLKSNTRAIQNNLYWGYKLLPNQEDVELQSYVLTKEDMLKNKVKTDRLKKILLKTI